MKKKSEKTSQSPDGSQRKFNLPLFPRRRTELASENKEAYNAGQIDAFVLMLKIFSPKSPYKEDWDNLCFDVADTRKIAIVAAKELLRQADKAVAKASVSQKILDQLQQKHLPF